MKKSGQIPIFTVAGTSFLVDVDKQVLRQTNDLSNEISFINDMGDKGTYYRLFYDMDRKNIPRETYRMERFKEIEVPPLIELDPEGMSVRYGVPVEQLKGKTDFEVIVDQEQLELRHKGVLPRIDIAGELFIVDLHLQELRHAANFYPVISLKSFELSNDGWRYKAFYHPVLKQIVEIDPKLTGFPESVIRIEIPNEIGLDPVKTAQQYGIDERELLRRHPIQKALKAVVIPLSETHLPGLIQRNREQLQREHKEITRQIRPKQRPHF